MSTTVMIVDPVERRGNRLWIAALTVLVVATGTAYELLWPAVVRHHGGYWMIPGDMWDTVRNAHWVGWGGLSYVYGADTGLVTLPGFPILLAPIAALASTLGLVESSPFIGLPRPDSWLLYGPVILAFTGLALAGLDALASQLQAGLARRRVMLVVAAAALWATTAMWGHPEDVVALGIACYAMTRVLQRRYTGAGWLLGLAIAMQLYVVLLVPVMLAVVGARRALPLLARASVAPAFLLVAVLVPNWRGTIHALWDQPNYPTVDHATPWMLVAPTLRPHVVAAGPGRLVAFFVAGCLGMLAVRFRHEPRLLVWLGAVALAGRCLFESVMVPYYVTPMVALALVAAFARPSGNSMTGELRPALVAALAMTLTVVVFWRLDMWVYWGSMSALAIAVLFASWPGRRVLIGLRAEDEDGRSQWPEALEQRRALLRSLMAASTRAAAGA